MNTTTLFERSSDLMVAEMDGDMVMMDVTQGSYFAINPVGAHVWSALETPQTLGALIESVQSGFDIDDIAQIETDVAAFLSDLANNNLVREVAG